jgi:predicted lipoprotein
MLALAGGDSVLDAYCDALGTAGEDAARTNVQAAWLTAMADLQLAQLHFIPSASDNSDSLNSRVTSYSESAVSTCSIDRAVVLAQDSSFSVSSRSLNQRGMEALDYLLFNTNLDHTCSTSNSETDTWNARPDLERKQFRCDYAKLVASDISDASTEINNSWQQSSANFRSHFINPDNTAVAVEALSDALFYLDVDVKDIKLGVTLGISSGCSQDACPNRSESRFSESSLTNIRNNLIGFQNLLSGNGGLGFDDLMIFNGGTETVNNFDAQIQDAIDLIDSMSESLVDQANRIETDGAAVACSNAAGNPDSTSAYPACNLYGLIKRITDDLKVDFVTYVNVDLPERAQSDND